VERDIALSQNGGLRNWWASPRLAYGAPGLGPINVCKVDLGQ